jgi:hypothetical protein
MGHKLGNFRKTNLDKHFSTISDKGYTLASLVTKGQEIFIMKNTYIATIEMKENFEISFQ